MSMTKKSCLWTAARALVVVLTLLAIAQLRPPIARANTITVQTLSDNDVTLTCSLRQAITNANDNAQTYSTCPAGNGTDVITFAVNGTIPLHYSLPAITDPQGLTINGAGHSVTISGQSPLPGGGNVQIITVNTGATLQLWNLTLTQGSAGVEAGGAILNNGKLQTANVVFSDNHAGNHGGAIASIGSATTGTSIEILNTTFTSNGTTNHIIGAVDSGGAIYSDESVTTITNSSFHANRSTAGGALAVEVPDFAVSIYGSTFDGNTAGSWGGAVYIGTSFDLTITNSTLYGNTAATSGGGIYALGPLVLLNSTVAGNDSAGGGGIVAGASAGLRNSILAHNTPDNCALAGVGALVNSGNDIDSGNSCSFSSASGSHSGTDPKLEPLANNGGSTLTMALLPDSPAIDAVTYNAPNDCPPDDQRGISRPLDGNHDGAAVCDIGALEFQAGAYELFLPLVLR